jgi:hypothetical protein
MKSRPNGLRICASMDKSGCLNSKCENPNGYWLKLTEPKEEQIMEKQNLIKEATELTKIFGSIVEKSK